MPPPPYLSDCLATTIRETVSYNLRNNNVMAIALRDVVCKLVPSLSFLTL